MTVKHDSKTKEILPFKQLSIYTDGASRGNPGEAGAGVIIFGEAAGATTSDKVGTYLWAGAATAVYPMTIGIIGAAGEGLDNIPTWIMLLNPVISSFAATIVYNLFKDPKMDVETIDTGFRVLPYNDTMVDSCGKVIATYGIEVTL